MERKENIQEELKVVAPLVASLPKSNPFLVPENYFDELETETQIAAGIKEVVERDPAHEKLPFDVPQNYFDQLPSAILKEIKNHPWSEYRRGRILSISKRWWWAAASVALILIVSISFLRNKNISTVASNSTMDTTFLLLENASGLSEAVVVDFYAQDQATASEDTSLNQYLIEATGIDAEVIYSL